jgi:ABC-2 type transport system permease protein
MSTHKIYFFSLIIAPLASFIFFADLLKKGIPTDLPVAIVDEDNSSTSRSLAMSLDAFANSKIVLKTSDFSIARKAMQEGQVYGILRIPAGFKKDASSSQAPILSFYTNDSYILPGSLVYKDLRLQTALANGVVQRTMLVARGGTEPELSAQLNPIVVDTHPLNNPWLSYGIYLANTLIPAVFAMFVMLLTVYGISSEIKENTSSQLLAISNGSAGIALLGKLAAQFTVFFIMGSLYLLILYRILNYPANSGIAPMLLAMGLLIVACQSFALFVAGLFDKHRIALSITALWSVLSFSIIGFTFPLRSMPEPLQIAANIFPMRHYFMIYVDQALNGIPMYYSWLHYAALAMFIVLPITVYPLLKRQLQKGIYTT